MAADDAPFLSRWARRKAAAREGVALPESAPPAAPPPPVATVQPVAGPVEAAVDPKAVEPPPTLDDVAKLTTESDFTRFVARDVQPDVKNAALKKLFTDPHFNVMDGLDIYIDDYGKPDPLPADWLAKMVQSKALGLFDDEPDANTDAAKRDTPPPPSSLPTAEPPASEAKRHEDTDLQLQPDDDAGRTGPEPGV